MNMAQVLIAQQLQDNRELKKRVSEPKNCSATYQAVAYTTRYIKRKVKE